MKIPIKSGALVPVLLMLPNLVWMLFPKASPNEPVSVPPALSITENVSRIAVLVIPLFYTLGLSKRLSPVGLSITGFAVIIYYAAWIRYFMGGQTAELFRVSLIGIPLPMAVAPTVFLVFSSYLLGSWPMLAASICFGTAHIWLSYLRLF